MKEKSDEKKHKGKPHPDGGEAKADKLASTADLGSGQGPETHSPAAPAAGSDVAASQGTAGGKPAGAKEGEVTAAGDAGAEPRAELAAELEKLLREKQELEDQYLRLRADFENFRKRVNKEKANLIQYGNEALLRDLLPVIDNIERALPHSLQEGDWGQFRQGIELVLTDLHKTLASYGVVPVEALGKQFDPNVHEAVQRIVSDQAAPGTVVEEFQRGYLFRGMLLRAARVAVAVAEEVKEEAGVADPDGFPGQAGNGGVTEEGEKIIN